MPTQAYYSSIILTATIYPSERVSSPNESTDPIDPSTDRRPACSPNLICARHLRHSSHLPSRHLRHELGWPMSAIDTPFNDPYLALLYHPQSPSASASHPSSSPIRAALLPSTNARRVSASSVSPSRPHSILPSLYASSIRRQSDSAIKHQTHVMNPDVLASTPAPVTRFLILSAPLIRFLRSSLEVILWRDKEGKAKSITLLAGWWALCLLGWGIVR